MRNFDPNKLQQFIANQQHQAGQNSASMPATPVAARPDTVPTPSVPVIPVPAPVAAAPTIQQPEEKAPFTNGEFFHYLLQRVQYPDALFTAGDLKIKWGLTDDQTRRLLADLRAAHVLEVDNKIKNRDKIIELFANMSDTSLQEKYTFPADDHPSLATPDPVASPTPIVTPITPANPQPVAAPIPPVIPAPAASPSPAAAPAAAPADPARAGAAAKTLFERILAGANNNKATIAVGAFASALLVAGALQTRTPKTTPDTPPTQQTVPKAGDGQPGVVPKKELTFSQNTGTPEAAPDYKDTLWFIQLDNKRKEAVAHILDTQDAQGYTAFFFKELPEAHGTKRTKLTLEQQRNLYKYLNNGGGVLLSIARSADPVPAWVLDSPGGAQQTEGSYNMQTNVQEMLTNFAAALPPQTKLPLEKTFAEIYNQVRNTLIEEIRSTQAKQ